MANVVLDEVSLNIPVADTTARLAIPTASLQEGVLVTQLDDNSLWKWTGSAWVNLSIMFSEYDAFLVSGVSADPYYPGVSQAYAASKVRALLGGTVTEGNDTTLADADEMYVKIASQGSLDLADKTIAGGETIPNGVGYTLVLGDNSSSLKYSRGDGSSPFQNFDEHSTLVLRGNGGNLINQSTVDDSAIVIEGRLIVKDLKVTLPNKSNGGIHTSLYSSLDNIEFNGTGTDCAKAFNLNGGNVRNIVLKGTFASSATLNDADNPTNVDNLISYVDGACVLQLNGNANNILALTPPTTDAIIDDESLFKNIAIKDRKVGKIVEVRSTGRRLRFNGKTWVQLGDFSDSLIVSLASNTNVTNITAGFLAFLATVQNCNVSGGVLFGGLSLAVDGSNSNINLTGLTFTTHVEIYGTNINFTACNFLDGYTANTGAVGVIQGCNATGTVTNVVTMRRTGNDATIGNDY